MIKALSLLLAACSLGAAESRLLLPKGVEASWIFESEKASVSAPLFDIDAKGQLWMLPHPRILALPTGGSLPSKEDLRDLAFDSRGRLYLLSDRAAGPMQVLPKDEEERRWIRVKEKLLLPGPGWRLAAGGPDMLCYGYNPENARYEVWRLRDKRKLFDSERRIHALQPEGNDLRISFGESTVLASPSGAAKAGSVPGGIAHFAHAQGGLLFAAGPERAWLMGAKPLPILEAPYARLRARGAALYVGLRQGGILKLEGLQHLENLR